MIGYVTLGTNDLKRAAKFYDALFAELGASRFMEMEGEDQEFIAWSISPDQPGVGLTTPHDKKAASVGNGVMVALLASSPEQVDAVYNKAIELGATDEGPAGPRDGLAGFYAGYFRDLDGNKLNVFHMAPDAA